MPRHDRARHPGSDRGEHPLIPRPPAAAVRGHVVIDEHFGYCEPQPPGQLTALAFLALHAQLVARLILRDPAVDHTRCWRAHPATVTPHCRARLCRQCPQTSPTASHPRRTSMTTTSTTRPADCIVTGPYLPGECNTPCTPGGKDCPTTTTVPTVPGSTIAPDVFHITNLPPTGGTSTMLALALVVTAGGGWATRMARRH